MSRFHLRRLLPNIIFCLSATLALLLHAGCGKGQSAASHTAPAALEVAITTVKTEPVTLARELPGRTSAYRIAEVRARITGIVQQRLFTEGADVKEGDVLFEIDPAPYQAALDSAKASLARARANLPAATAQAERFQGLVATNAISKQNYDNAVASLSALEAEVAAAQAAVRAAEINVGYTRVTSPISGRVGRAEVTEGAYVQQGTATLLATVQQLDPLYIDLTQSVDEVLRLKQALASGRLQGVGNDVAKISILLGNGESYAHAGSLQFSDVSVNPTTGTVKLRGVVPNPDMDLLPGMFVRARLEEGTNPDAILIPQAVVSRNARGDATVMVVDAGRKAELRTIQASRAIGDRWLVTGGLEPGDQIISNNLQKIQPGTPVNPVAAPAPVRSPTSQAQVQPAH